MNAQENQRGTNAPADFASDLTVVHDAQEQALQQARELLAQGENLRDRPALETAVKQMELAQTALADAKKSPKKLPAALAAEQAAYQALLKVTPREYRMTRSRSGNPGGQSQSQQRQMDQLEMPKQENRYEIERPATVPQNAQQREQTQTADRLKELSQRQQDLNERLRELQNSLAAAHTDQEREEIQHQLKRLRDEERQMLAKVDELRQQIAQSPNAGSQSETQKKMDQARNDMERASQAMEKESASQALAAGTRAQQTMQNLRDDLRRQTGSQFSEQMRQLRNEARDLTKQQDEIAGKLDSLNRGAKQSLDNSAERQQLAEQMARQQNALTNLLAEMRSVTEQAESTEPLLSKELYDTLRRADQMHTENLLDLERQLTGRGFLPQADQAGRMARTNIIELARNVEGAADSVLGSEADALRYAQKQLDDLTRQMEREITGTNAAAAAAGENGGANGGSNRVARAAGNAGNGARGPSTNEDADANDRLGKNGSQPAGNNPQGEQPGEGNSASAGQNGNRGEQPNGSGNNGEQASAERQQNGQGGEGEAPAGNGQRGNRSGNQQQANNNSPGQQPGARNGGNANNGGTEDGNGGGGDGLRQFVQQLGRGDRSRDAGGPITGNGYVNWSDQLRNVEQVVDSQDLRNQLATVRERAAVVRGEYRDLGRKPDGEKVRQEIIAPLSQVRVWLAEELARKENVSSLVPLDRDPVPENYSELVRKYYEKLGSAQ